ncbi:MAG: hypothetical protein Q9170_005751 [Blastenia crenularia]
MMLLFFATAPLAGLLTCLQFSGQASALTDSGKKYGGTSPRYQWPNNTLPSTGQRSGGPTISVQWTATSTPSANSQQLFSTPPARQTPSPKPPAFPSLNHADAVALPSTIKVSIIAGTKPGNASTLASPSSVAVPTVFTTTSRSNGTHGPLASDSGAGAASVADDSLAPPAATMSTGASRDGGPAPSTSTTPPASPVSSDLPRSTSAYHDDLIAFIQSGRHWLPDLAKPEVDRKALDDIEKLSRSTENQIQQLGGSVVPHPPGSCSTGARTGRRLSLLEVIRGLAGNALGLVRCVDDVVDDLSAEIKQLTTVPPSLGTVKLIEDQLNALDQAAKEQGDEHPSASMKASSHPSSTDSITSAPSPASSTVWSSSSTAQSSSSPVDSCSVVVDNNQADNGGNVLHHRRSLIKDRRPAAAPLYPRADSPRSIKNISVCFFLSGVEAVQPAYLGYSQFWGLESQRNGQRGRNGRVWDATSKWYLVRRRPEIRATGCASISSALATSALIPSQAGDALGFDKLAAEVKPAEATAPAGMVYVPSVDHVCKDFPFPISGR